MRRSRLPLAILALFGAVSLRAQPDRIFGPIDAARVVAIAGSLRPAILLQNDLGPVDANFPLPAMTLFLKPSPTQQVEFRQLLDNQQNPRSPLYHRWITPEEFAARFGASPNDIAAAADWLRASGFTIAAVARSRAWIVFSGPAGQVKNVFHAEIHRYQFSGESHFANAAEPSIPLALADLVAGIDGLDDFSPGEPEMTSPSGVHTLAPDDLALIYDLLPLYQSGIDGAGQSLVVVGTSDFNASALADVAAFRAQFNLPPNVPQVVSATGYPNPGVNPNSINEAHLDVEWSGAVARNAQIVFVYADTFLHAIAYAIDNDLAPVITASFNNGCEAVNNSSNMNLYRALAQQANAEGITWINSGGDSGPAACDGNGAAIAEGGLAVRFPASIPEVTAVGGSEFDEQGGAYWAANNTANGASALSYIPEMVWNDALALNALWAGGGGASSYFPKPAWQAGRGVPDDQARDMPDVVMDASFSHDGYFVIRNGVTVTTGGTSAAAPVFAGIVTLLNQYGVSNGSQEQPGQGNLNSSLYRLARMAGVFHDITVGNNLVPCVTGTPNCSNGRLGFSAGPGYDQASGLGSVDAANLLACQASRESVITIAEDAPGQRPTAGRPPELKPLCAWAR